MTGHRVTVLLGAGASRDAGLPLTEDLAKALVESFEQDLGQLHSSQRPSQQQVVRALHIVYGAMVAHATEQGDSPLRAVNVERLVSAVRLLRDRRTHEAAPFISAWRGSVEEMDGHPVPFRDSDIRLKIDLHRGLDKSGMAADIAAIARAAVAPGDGSTFARLEDQLLRRIVALLSVPVNVDYLHPLTQLARAQAGGLDITTLNYDRTVELAAEDLGVPVDTGLDRWRPGSPVLFEQVDGRINLIKPHGSVDWVRQSGGHDDPIPDHPLVRYRYKSGVTADVIGSPYTTDTPLIVIGDREKLATDGPTLPLMRAFEEALGRATKLVVVGYSFGDDHINTVVRNWLAADKSHMISILDPGWPRPQQKSIRYDTQLGLRDALQFMAGIPPVAGPSRVVVTREGARSGLRAALEAEPLVEPPNAISVILCLSEQPCIRITNHGYDLEHIRLWAWAVSHRPTGQGISRLRLDPSSEGSEQLSVGRLGQGEHLIVFVDLTPGAGAGDVRIEAETWARGISERTVFENLDIVTPAEEPARSTRA